jgi:hypothetical protein
VRTFKDSTHLINDPPALREQMRSQGYLFFAGLLDREEVLAVARAELETLAEIGWVQKGCPLDEVRPACAEPQEGAEYDTGITAVQRLESLHRLPHSTGLTRVRRALLGDASFLLPSHVARVVWPPKEKPGRDNSSADWIHQDYSIFHVPDMFTAWYPLLDTAMERGPLRILAGSHRSGVVGRIWEGQETGIATDDERWHSIDYRAGDVVVFHCLTAHTGMANRTPYIRLSCEVRMQATQHPVPTVGLAPVVFLHWRVAPQLASVELDWRRLGANWSSQEWCQYPPEVRVFEHTDPAVMAITTHPTSAFL